jgi:hypothetical protein
MSYLAQAAMAQNAMLFNRVAQCAASESIENPDQWTSENRRQWSASPGWDAAWSSALAAHEGDQTYDPGMDEAVITDAMILSEVQSLSAT